MLVVRCPPAARSLAIAEGGKCFEVEWSFTTNVCLRSSEYMWHLLINRGATTEALLFVRLAKMSRVFNGLVTGQAATDSAHFFASSLGGAQPTLAMRCRPAARLLARAQGWQVFRSGVTICKTYFLGGIRNI